MNDTNLPAPSLATKALLVDMTIKFWNAVTCDEDVTSSVQREYEAQRDSGAYRKKLLPHDPKEWKDLRAARLALMVAHKKFTLPWSTGMRILTREAFLDYGREVAKLRADFDAAVEAFLAVYPQEIEKAMLHQGRMANPLDYPEVNRLRRQFGVSIDYAPVPDRGDFRVDLDAEYVNGIKEQIEQHTAARVQEAQRELWERMIGTVEHFAGVLTKVQASEVARMNGDETANTPIIRESLIKNVEAMAKIAETLNLADDPRILEMRDEMQSLVYDRKDLRDHAALRIAAIKRADDITNKMRAFMPRAREQ